MEDILKQPWINLTDYTLTEVILFLVGVICWGYAYIKVIFLNEHKKTLEIPFVAVCLNYGWEVGSVFFYTKGIDMGKLFVLGYFIWFFLDTLIVWQMFKYAHTQVRNPYLAQHLKPLLLIGLIGSIAAHSYFYMEGFELPMSVISAYVINLAMSIAYCGLAFNPEFHGLSKSVAWAKGMGTGIISVCFYLKYPETNFLTTMYILTFFFDAYYLYLLYYVRKTI